MRGVRGFADGDNMASYSSKRNWRQEWISNPHRRDDRSCVAPSCTNDLGVGNGGEVALLGLSMDELVSVSLPDSEIKCCPSRRTINDQSDSTDNCKNSIQVDQNTSVK